MRAREGQLEGVDARGGDEYPFTTPDERLLTSCTEQPDAAKKRLPVAVGGVCKCGECDSPDAHAMPERTTELHGTLSNSGRGRGRSGGSRSKAAGRGLLTNRVSVKCPGMWQPPPDRHRRRLDDLAALITRAASRSLWIRVAAAGHCRCRLGRCRLQLTLAPPSKRCSGDDSP